MIIAKNGFVRYDEFRNAVYKISSNRRGTTIDTISIWIGTYLFTDCDNYKKHTRMLSRKLNNFFNKHSKDGYYKPKFLLIEHLPDSLRLNGKGYISYEPFLFLEERYTRDFVHPYIESLFQQMDDEIFSERKDFIIKKAGKNKLLDESTNYHSI